MTKRFATLLTALAFGQSLTLLTTSAHAGNDKEALELAEKALYEDYLNLEFDAAKAKLTQAIELCEADCNPANTAKVYRDLGVLYVAGLKQREQGVEMFKKALAADPNVAPNPDLSTPEIESAFEEAKASAPDSTLGAAMRDSVGAPPDEPSPEEPEPPVAEPAEEEPEPAPPPPEEKTEPEPPRTKLDLDTSDCPPDFPGCESYEDRWEQEEAEAAAGRFPRHWLSLGYQMDFLLLDAAATACTGATYQCFDEQGEYRDPSTLGVYDPLTNTTAGQGQVASGLAMATSRVLVGYDFGITPEFLVGIRGGFAFAGGPQKNTTPPGKEFQPIHAELRVGYWFTGVKSGTFRPFVQLSGGLAQVDAKVNVPVVDSQNAESCSNQGRGSDPSCYEEGMDAWRKTGTAFVGGGLGTMIALGDSHGFIVEGRGMQMLGASGLAAAVQAGYTFGL